MLRLFKDTVHIGLYTDRIVLVRVSGGLHRRSTQQASAPVTENGHAAPGSAALDVLAQMLQEPLWQDADARVQVSNALVYYTTVPASEALMGAADEIALAQLKFRQMHGLGSSTCEVRLGNLMSGHDQIAAALDSGMVQRLRQILQSAKLTMRSLEPLLMSAFNRVRHQLKGDDFWFALAEPGLLMLGRWRQGHWVSLSASSLHEPLSVGLPAQLLEARLMGGDPSDTRRVYLLTQGVDSTGCASGPDLDLVNLTESKKPDPIATAYELGFALEAVQ